MKQSKKTKSPSKSSSFPLINYIRGLGATKKRRLFSILLFTLLFVLRLGFCNNYSTNYMYPDSFTYDEASTLAFLHGDIDKMRTPIYPAIIDFFKLFSEEHRLILTILFQRTISFISIIFLYKILCYFCKKKKICLFVTFIYGLFPVTLSYDNLILTESLSLSLSIFICYSVIQYLRERSTKTAILISVLVVIAVFMRPAFIYLAVAWAGFLFIQLFSKKSPGKISHFVFSLVPALLVVCYCFGFYNQYGVFTLCAPSIDNTIGLILQRNYNESVPEHEISKLIQLKPDIGYSEFKNYFSLREIDEYNKLVLSKNRVAQIKDTAKLASNSAQAEFVNYAQEKPFSKKNIFFFPSSIYPTIKLGGIYFTLLVCIGFFIYLVHLKSFSWLYFYLVAVIAAPIIISLLNSPGEYGRLMITTIPLSCIAQFIMFSYIFKWLPKENPLY